MLQFHLNALYNFLTDLKLMCFNFMHLESPKLGESWGEFSL